MKQTFLFWFLSLAIGAGVQAQNVKVSGMVSTEDQQPLEMANVIAMNATDSSMAAFAFSDSKGQYEMRLSDGQKYIMRISYMGYETYEKELVVPEKSADIVFHAKLKVQPEFLQEANVVENMPVVISGDTISYKAEAFNTGTEKKLEDVLENLPGVEVEDDGQITVEGKTVEKVLVEGKEFFDGDTKIATKNIPANAIDKVQVLRNYNDVSPLGGVTNNSDRVALNITLKDGKKSMVFGDVEAAGGPEGRYLAHPNIFYYTPKASINFIGDMNNVGKPALNRQDFFRFTGGFNALAQKAGSNFSIASDIGVPLTSNDRNVEVRSDFAAANFNINPNKAWSINGFAIYLHNDVIKKTNTLNNYVGQDSLADQELVEADEYQEDHSLLGKLNVKYTPSPQVYIAYNGFTKYTEIRNQEDKLSTFDVTQRNISEVNDQNPFELNQNLEAVWDINEKSIISFEGQHQYKRQDPLFNLRTDQNPNFGFIIPMDSALYDLKQNRLITTNRIDAAANYYYILNKRNHIELNTGGSYADQALTSGLTQMIGEIETPLTDSVVNTTNDVRFKLADAFVGVHYKTKLGNLEMRPGLNLHYYQTNDIQLGNDLQRSWTMLLPDFFAKYDFKKSENITLNYTMQAGFTDVNNAATGAILQSYNSLFVGNQYLDNALYHNVTLRYFNFNLYTFTNIYAGFTYNKRLRQITNQVRYNGVDRVNSPINSPNVNDAYTLFAGYSRRFSYYRVSVRANGTYTLTNNLINAEQNSNGALNHNYTLRFSTNFKEAPNVTVGYRVALSNYTGTNVANNFINHRPYAEFEWLFFKNFLFEAEYQYNYYTSPNTGPSSIFDFLDASLTYYTTNEKWEFKAGATNILGTEYIRQDSFNNSVTSTQEIYVLPRYLLFGVKYNL